MKKKIGIKDGDKNTPNFASHEFSLNKSDANNNTANSTQKHTEKNLAEQEIISRFVEIMTVYKHAISVLCTKLPQTAKLVEDSTKTMSLNFVDFASGIREQSKKVGEISELSNSLSLGNEKISMEEFTELFANTLRGSIEQILFVSKRSIEMVYMLDEAIKSIATIEGFVTDIHAITKKANLLALNASIEAARAGEAGISFGVVADEVKQVSNTIRDIAESINSRIATVSKNVHAGFAVLQDVATTDMTQTMMAQDKLNLMMHSMIQQKDRFASVLHESAVASEEISESLSGMVINLQFQDRTTQYIDSSVRLLSFMNEKMQNLSEEAILKFPNLKNMDADEKLIKEVGEQFSLGEFSKLFNQSVHGTNDDNTVASEDIEFF